MPKKIWKRVNNIPILVSTLEDSVSKEDIPREVFIQTGKNLPEYYPSYIYVFSNRNDDYFIQTLFDIIAGQPQNLLEDDNYRSDLLTNIQRDYKSLTKIEFEKAIDYIQDPSSTKLKNDILSLFDASPTSDINIDMDDFNLDDSELSLSDIKEETDQEPSFRILRFSSNFGKIFSDVDLFSLYEKFTLDKNLLLAKTLKGEDPQFLDFGLSAKKQSKISFFIFSEHKKEKVLKKLVGNQLRLLFYEDNDDIKYECMISNTGFVSVKLESNKLTSKNFNLKSIKIKEKIRDIYTFISGNLLEEDVTFTDFFTKIFYPTIYGFIPKNTVGLAEQVSLKNDKIFIKDLDMYYSTKNQSMNFSNKTALNSLANLDSILEKVETRINYYINNFCIIEKMEEDGEESLNGVQHSILYVYTKYLHNADDKYKYLKLGLKNYPIKKFTDKMIAVLVKKDDKYQTKTYLFSDNIKNKEIKEMKQIGLQIKANQCEKKRRPVLLKKSDKSTGENILEINGRKFKCIEPYKYHGLVGKTNCCFIKKPIIREEEIVPSNSIIENKILILKKLSPLKTYNFKNKFEVRTLTENLEDYLSEDYVLLNVALYIKERSIETCIKSIYGDDIIEKSIETLDSEGYKSLGNSYSIEKWKESRVKALSDILLAVSIYKGNNIIILSDSTADGLKVSCDIIKNFQESVIIYKSTENKEAYYVLIKRDLNDITYIHKEEEIQDLINITKEQCSIEFSETPKFYKDIIKSQVTDFQDLVVFIEIKTGGYIPVAPSTIDPNIPVIKIDSPNFKLQSPKNQYESLLKVSKIYRNLEPESYTVILDTDIVSSIKLRNGQYSPVVNTTWEQNFLQKSEDLFYIEKYYSQVEDFQDETLLLKENIDKLKAGLSEDQKIDINKYIKGEEYLKIIDIVKSFGIETEYQISKLTWFLINNETNF